MSDGTTGGRVLLASNNAKKLAELRRIVEPLVPSLTVLGLGEVPAYPEPVEDEPSFAGNALLKARAAVAATGLPSLADDSGLCIDALNGMPGVLSARWSGLTGPGKDRANNALVLHQLADVPEVRRTARFVCAVALCLPDGTEIVEHGEMAGRVLFAEDGEGGFGYDPLFAATGYDVSTARLDAAEKDRISHRGHALAAIAPRVAAALV